MTKSEVLRVEHYLREKFGNATISIRQRSTKDDSAEVMLGDEFIGVVFRDDEDGEVSYDFHMAIMDMDLPKVIPVS